MLSALAMANTQMFQTVYADPNKLVLKAYSWEGEQLDGFQLQKKNGRGVSSEFPKPAAAGASAGE
jgi:hypothetical protein